MNHWRDAIDDDLIEVQNAQAGSAIVVVCEHASAHIPSKFNKLGLDRGALSSHVAWDLGAMAVATKMAATLDAVLVAAKTSRLVYDCNRPPEAKDAMPAHSEFGSVPGNAGVSAADKAERVSQYYLPFKAAVSAVMNSRTAPVLVTMHSFTPVFKGQARDVEIGVLHDSDARLADALLSISGTLPHLVRRNEPYGPKDGVTHTLKEHALAQGHLNVMLEVRNDLIGEEAAQTAMADILSNWVLRALAMTEAAACKD